MDNATYETSALRTEAPISEAVAVRATAWRGAMLSAMNAQRALGELIDGIKKTVFYGKQVDFDRLAGSLAAAFHDLESEVGPNGHLAIKRVPVNRDAIRLLHSAMGIAGEAGEIAQTVEGMVAGSIPLRDGTNNLVEEYGDLLWYVPPGLSVIGVSISKVMQANIDKLQVRYPQKFSEANATTRDTRAELDAIDKSISEAK